jgi:hypothetical protein
MTLKDGEHDWQRPHPSKKTTWVCTRCGCTRISKEQPPPHMLVVLEKNGAPWGKRGIRGPRPGEPGLSCGFLQVKLVMES